MAPATTQKKSKLQRKGGVGKAKKPGGTGQTVSVLTKDGTLETVVVPPPKQEPAKNTPQFDAFQHLGIPPELRIMIFERIMSKPGIHYFKIVVSKGENIVKSNRVPDVARLVYPSGKDNSSYRIWFDLEKTFPLSGDAIHRAVYKPWNPLITRLTEQARQYYTEPRIDTMTDLIVFEPPMDLVERSSAWAFVNNRPTVKQVGGDQLQRIGVLVSGRGDWMTRVFGFRCYCQLADHGFQCAVEMARALKLWPKCHTLYIMFIIKVSDLTSHMTIKEFLVFLQIHHNVSKQRDKTLEQFEDQKRDWYECDLKFAMDHLQSACSAAWEFADEVEHQVRRRFKSAPSTFRVKILVSSHKCQR